MGFYVANEQQAVAGKPRSGSSRCAHGQKTPLKKSRLGFFSSTRSRAEFSVSQPVEPHRENEPTPTIIVSGVRYYGYRYYSPSLGRWLARDPAEDTAFRSFLKTTASPIQRNVCRLTDQTTRYCGGPRCGQSLVVNSFLSQRDYRSRQLPEHLYLFCVNKPINGIDPSGLYTYQHCMTECIEPNAERLTACFNLAQGTINEWVCRTGCALTCAGMLLRGVCVDSSVWIPDCTDKCMKVSMALCYLEYAAAHVGCWSNCRQYP